MSRKIPKRLQSILWSVDTDQLGIRKDKHYIIHQILIYGNTDELRWLFKTYSKAEIIKVFLFPYKNYPRETFYFTKNYILNLKDKNLNEDAYVTSIHGPVKLRATGSF